MSDGIVAVMSRISQIRSAFGSAARPAAQQSVGFDQVLSAAKKSSGGFTSTSTAAAKRTENDDPLDRLGVKRSASTATTKGANKALGSGSVGWPKGVPEEAEQYADSYIAASQATGVPLEILLAVSWAESAFQPGAESGVGAQGLMQLMPGTAAGLGVDPADPAQNIMGGARYLAAQYEAFGSWELAFAAYNAGPGAVEQYGGIPPYRETQNYVSIINSYLERISPADPATQSALANQSAVSGADTAAGGAQGALDAALRKLGVSDPVSPTLAADAGQQLLEPASLRGPVVDLTNPLQALDQHRLGADGRAVGSTASAEDGALAGMNNPNTGTVGGGRDANQSSPTMTTTPAGLPERLAALVERSRSNGQSSHRLTVRLDPPDLGNVELSFELKGDRVHIVVRPDSAEGGQLLSHQRDRIATLLAREGLELSGFDVGAEADGGPGARQSPASSRPYRAIDLDPITEVALTVDRELRL